MAWSSCITTLKTHATTAGASVTPQIKNVIAADIVPDTNPTITIAYAGRTDNPFGPDTFGKTQTGEAVEIKVWWPQSSFDKGAAEATELQMQAIGAALYSALEGDRQLGGNCEDMQIGDSEPKWEQRLDGTQIWRTLTLPVTVALADVDTITA